MNQRENKFDKFFKNRKNLIYQYKKGDMSKGEFIERNYNYIQSMNTKPFIRIDNIKKGVFNYQYYNVIAKYCQKRASEFPNRSFAKEDFIEKANYYYSKKDKVTLKILDLLDCTNIEAYYIKVKSHTLKNKLIEIVLTEYDDIILHTRNELIKEKLINEKILMKEKRKSLVDEYINNKY